MAASSSSSSSGDSGSLRDFAKHEVEAFNSAYNHIINDDRIAPESIEKLRVLRENIRLAFDNAIREIQNQSTAGAGTGEGLGPTSVRIQEELEKIKALRTAALDTSRESIDRATLKAKDSLIELPKTPGLRSPLSGVHELDAEVYSFLTTREIGDGLSVSRATVHLQVNSLKAQLRTLKSLSGIAIEKYRQGLRLPPDRWTDVLTFCSNLKHLDLSSFFDTKREEWVHIDIGQITTPLPSLKSINLKFSLVRDENLNKFLGLCPGLTKIYLYSCKQLTDVTMESLIKISHNLLSLDLSETSISTEALVSIIKNSPSLTYLNVDGDRVNDDVIRAFAPGSKLVTLRINNSDTLTDHGLRILGSNCKELTSLDFLRCKGITGDGIKEIAENCPKLASIYLESCFNVSAIGIMAIALNCSELTHIVLTHLIDDTCIDALIGNCPQLQSITLLVASDERIENLTKRYPGITISNT